ncbi:hypothetical protein PHYBLDRAFT_140809 [Phycomyces blakesleeanus NRRL 1555(-)]|uniref:Uncharacterized protein n=1 Tax=Phycomyces blakesleeanus (strain ATCC 8743b / DSM 1359 / FGSC 10004 / NBRC 33097 / NRRL 1555) TaxID=763407 RepID=A0A162UY74_PHYB8|nr:hypothetical protein PHYBLDRAFT_140809 [Phycomyces blakesleeanus NRRL 1555(-)]OAD78752.1 hypothetical protein PHYBLDRAFT_140809 [Phycomyces blakesleeanus NRRL 1555(-)]|eukprot:XP_018296792.1 hypothetical protein PHYBLDRAFT_140809 [Phycomyces blakesleeanus NRRL 1555(-)]
MLTKTSTFSRCRHFLKSLHNQKQPGLTSLCETTTMESSPSNSQDILLKIHKSSIYVDPEEFLEQDAENNIDLCEIQSVVGVYHMETETDTENTSMHCSSPITISSMDFLTEIPDAAAPSSTNGYSNFYLKLPNGNWQVRCRDQHRTIVMSYEVQIYTQKP